MTKEVELEKVIIRGEVQFLPPEEVRKLEVQYKDWLVPHTEKSKKEFDEA